jgi:hypothetical protein
MEQPLKLAFHCSKHLANSKEKNMLGMVPSDYTRTNKSFKYRIRFSF